MIRSLSSKNCIQPKQSLRFKSAEKVADLPGPQKWTWPQTTRTKIYLPRIWECPLRIAVNPCPASKWGRRWLTTYAPTSPEKWSPVTSQRPVIRPNARVTFWIYATAWICRTWATSSRVTVFPAVRWRRSWSRVACWRRAFGLTAAYGQCRTTSKKKW